MSNFHSVAIINITPDSFSDGGKYNTSQSFADRVEELKKFNCKFFDIGAESSAQMNSAIDGDEEIARFTDCLLPNLNRFVDGSTISIDTYKHKTISTMYQKIKEARPDLKLIWNDVSGVLDRDVIEILTNFSDLGYVYGHTHVTERSETLSHMDKVTNYVSNFEFMNALKSYFIDGQVRLSKFRNRIILDPGFGFSKSYEHNVHLIKNIYELINMAPDAKWMLGISRKSFLKKSVFLENEDLLTQVELLQMAIITKWMDLLKKKENDVLIRLHNPSIFENAQKYKTIFS